MKTFQTLFFSVAFAFSLQPAIADVASSRVIGWGNNIAGQVVGVPSITYSTNRALFLEEVQKMPRTVTGAVKINGQVLSNAVAIAAGYSHGLALRSDGTVVGWGWNRDGQANGIPTTTGLQVSNGVVMITGKVLNDVISIACGRQESFALLKNGGVISWGSGVVPSGVSNVVAISSSDYEDAVVTSDGTAFEWTSSFGSSSRGQIHFVSGLSNAIAISTGGGDSARVVALKKDGGVFTWGNETTYGDMTPPFTLSNIVAVSSGYNHSLALNKDGTVFGWGFNSDGQATGIPSINGQYVSSGLVRINGQVLQDVAAIDAGNEFSLALKKDGSVVLWGRNSDHCLDVPSGLTNIIAIAAGDNFCLALQKINSIFTK